MRCAVCQFENPTGQNFCGRCAADLRQLQLCRACNSINPLDFRYCGNCGERLTGATQASQGSERRHLTVMFCDLTESTPLAGRLEIEDYRNLVNDYLGSVHRIIGASDGYVAQDLGDGVLVYFGFPVAREDDALRAVRAALSILDAFRNLNKSMLERYGVGARVRVGIHTGNVITGEVGSEKRLEQLAVGLAVNIAARVQHEAAPDEVWMTSDTYKLVRRDVIAENLGPKKFKGVLDPVDIYRAVSLRPARAAKDADGEPPFVGRGEEMAELIALLRSAVDGHGRLVLVKGDPGIGKSRLIDELANRGSADSQWITCRCSAYHQDADLFPIVGTLRRLMGISEQTSIEEREAALSNLLSEAGLAPEEAADILRPLFFVGQSSPQAVPDARRHRFELLKRWLYGVAARRPVVLVIEDVHWADPSTLELITLLSSSVDQARLLVLITARSGFRPDWEPKASSQALIEVGRLSDEDATTLMQEWSLNNLPRSITDELVARADGVPLYLEELTRAMVATRSMVKSTTDLERIIPDSLRDLLMARIDGLGDAKEITQVGALLGRSFSREMLQAVTGIDADRLEGLLYRTLDAGILVPVGSDSEARFRFRHSLIQEAAYDSLLKSRRVELHTRVVAAIAEHFPRLRESAPGTLARHHEGAGQIRAAVDAYMLAAQQASDRSANEESIRIYDKASELLAGLPEDADRRQLEYALLTKKCEPLRAKHGYANEQIRLILERLEELRPAVNNPNRFNEMFAKWGYHCMAGDGERTQHFAKDLKTFAASSDKPIHDAVAAFAAGSTAFYQGRFSDALPDLRRCIAVADKRGFGTRARDVDGTSPLFLAHLVIGWCLSLCGRLDEAATMFEKIDGLARNLESEFGGSDLPRRAFEFGAVQSKTFRMFSNEDTYHDRAETLRLAEDTERIAKEYDFERWIRVGRSFRLRSFLMLNGSRDSALRELLDALESTIAIEEVTAGYELTRMGEVLLQFGELASARRALARALDLGETNLGCLHAPEANRLQGVLCLREGRRDSAIHHLHASLAASQTFGSLIQELRTHVTLASELPDAARDMVSRFHDAYGAIVGGEQTPLLRQARALLS